MYPNPDTLQTGNVLMCHSLKGLEAKIIRKVLDSPWNHAAIIVVIEGKVYAVEAMGGRPLGIMPYERWCNTAEREVEVLPFRVPASNILDLCGLPYDKTSCWNIFLQKHTGRWYGRKEGRGREKVYCFEGICLMLGIANWWNATPQVIINYYNENYKQWHKE